MRPNHGEVRADRLTAEVRGKHYTARKHSPGNPGITDLFSGSRRLAAARAATSPRTGTQPPASIPPSRQIQNPVNEHIHPDGLVTNSLAADELVTAAEVGAVAARLHQLDQTGDPGTVDDWFTETLGEAAWVALLDTPVAPKPNGHRPLTAGCRN